MRAEVLKLERQLLTDRRSMNEAMEKTIKDEKALADIKDRMKVKSALAKERIELLGTVGKIVRANKKAAQASSESKTLAETK